MTTQAKNLTSFSEGIADNGYVGIGTTNPTHTLDVLSTLAVPLKLKSDNTAGTGLYLDNNRTGSKTFGILSGNVAAGYFNIKDEDAGVNRLVISDTGNVGIGTQSPGEKLEVNGSFKIGNLKIQNVNGGRIGFNRNTANGDIYDSNFAAFQINGAYSGADFMSFEAYTSGGVGTDALVIRDNGNIGIGTNNPADTSATYKNLQVALGATVIGRTDDTPLYLSSNLSYNSDWKYIANTTATQIRLDTNLRFYTAPAGTAGNTATLSERMRITSSGDVIQGNNGSHSWTANNNTLFAGGGIGITSNSDWCLQLAGSTAERIRFFSSNGSTTTVGNISVSTAGTTYTTTSDRRLKDNIEPISDATDKLMDMKPVTHTWIANPETPQVHGFIAQEMQEVLPEAVSGNAESDEMMSMDYGRITPVIVAALQDALNEIKELKTRIDELENN